MDFYKVIKGDLRSTARAPTPTIFEGLLHNGSAAELNKYEYRSIVWKERIWTPI